MSSLSTAVISLLALVTTATAAPLSQSSADVAKECSGSQTLGCLQACDAIPEWQIGTDPTFQCKTLLSSDTCANIPSPLMGNTTWVFSWSDHAECTVYSEPDCAGESFASPPFPGSNWTTSYKTSSGKGYSSFRCSPSSNTTKRAVPGSNLLVSPAGHVVVVDNIVYAIGSKREPLIDIEPEAFAASINNNNNMARQKRPRPAPKVQPRCLPGGKYEWARESACVPMLPEPEESIIPLFPGEHSSVVPKESIVPLAPVAHSSAAAAPSKASVGPQIAVSSAVSKGIAHPPPTAVPTPDPRINANQARAAANKIRAPATAAAADTTTTVLPVNPADGTFPLAGTAEAIQNVDFKQGRPIDDKNGDSGYIAEEPGMGTFNLTSRGEPASG